MTNAWADRAPALLAALSTTSLPAHHVIRKAVDAVVRYVSSGDAAARRDLTGRFTEAYRARFRTEAALTSHLETLHRAVGGPVDGIAVERDPEGLLVNLTGRGSVTLRLSLDGSGRSGGFALVAVLSMLVAVGAAGIAFQAAARAGRRAVANARGGVRARWAAHAGAPMGMALPPVQFRLNQIAVRARTYDARARVNLNLADERQLVQLFGSLGLDRPQAVSLSAAVLDWRDPDAVVRRGGAEAGAYAARRPPSHPRNGPFTAVEELRGVLGVTPPPWRRSAGEHRRARGVHRNWAPLRSTGE